MAWSVCRQAVFVNTRLPGIKSDCLLQNHGIYYLLCIRTAPAGCFQMRIWFLNDQIVLLKNARCAFLYGSLEFPQLCPRARFPSSRFLGYNFWMNLYFSCKKKYSLMNNFVFHLS